MKFQADIEEAKRLEQERAIMDNLQREVDAMHVDMVKMDCLDFWSQ